MLRKIPDSALPFIRDGVLGARHLGLSEDAERLAQHARKRAAELTAAAREDAERQSKAALRAGYRDGFERALATWLPKFADLLADEAQWTLRTRQALERYLDVVLTDAGVEAALIARSRDTAAVAGDAAANAWTLYLPEDRAGLEAQLADRCPGLQVRRGEAPWPVLECGDLVIDIDPKRPAARHLGALLEADALQDVLDRHARDYADATLRALRDERLRTHLRQHAKGDTP